MSTTSQTTYETVRPYHHGWTSADIDTAGRHLAETFTTRAPVGSHDTKSACLAGLPRHARIVPGLDLISELHGENEAALIYDVHTNTHAGALRTAEHFELAGGKITSTLLIFDAADWKAMLASQGVPVNPGGYVIRPTDPTNR